MGEPWHLASKRPELKPVIAKSSNYVLYGDMSRRVFDVLCDMTPRVEPYSIDEMFMDYAGLPGDLVERSASHSRTRLRVAKIPTCVGIGPTKTIAKLANKLAKADRSGLWHSRYVVAGTPRRTLCTLQTSSMCGGLGRPRPLSSQS
jgi:DNA polymerase V